MGRAATAAAAASLWAIPISILVDRIVPQPYMVTPLSLPLFSIHFSFLDFVTRDELKTLWQDEIFHVPQVHKYCRGDFWSWDPMITTPPGLSVSFSTISLPQISSFL